MTPLELIRLSLLNTGISLYQTIYAEDIYRAFDHLNMMVSQWNRKRWLIYSLLDVSFVCTGADSYTIGVGEDIDTPRPDQLQAAYVRLLNSNNNPNGQPDLVLQVIESREDYSQIALKKLTTIPTAIFYDSNFPNGRIYPYPVPPGGGQYEIHLILKNSISQFADLTTDISLPPEYIDALMWNLAARLEANPNPTVMENAKKSLNVLRGANTQISHLGMPSGVPGMGRGRYTWHGVWPSGIYY